MVAQHSHRFLDRAPQTCPYCSMDEFTIKQGKSYGKTDYQKWFCQNCKVHFRTLINENNNLRKAPISERKNKKKKKKYREETQQQHEQQ